jgi:hypothetical protein
MTRSQSTTTINDRTLAGAIQDQSVDFPINRFKRDIVSAKTPLGAWLMCGTPSTAEALGRFRLPGRRHGAHADRHVQMIASQAIAERRPPRWCDRRGTTW